MAAKRLYLDNALAPKSSLRRRVQNGLGALKKADAKLIDPGQRQRVGDSLDLDEATRKELPDRPRWDYLLSVPDRPALVGIEPHAARDSEVSLVIAKKQVAREYLRDHLSSSSRVSNWYWVTRGRVGFSDTEKARRQLDQNGIEFVGRIVRSLGE